LDRILDLNLDLFCNSRIFRELLITVDFSGCLARALLSKIFKKIKLIKRKKHVDFIPPEKLILEKTTGSGQRSDTSCRDPNQRLAEGYPADGMAGQ
jgi:hypothetical protein